MKTHKNWSYAPYRPLFFEVGDIYICRVAPLETSITFDWLPLEEKEEENYNIYVSEREQDAFTLVGETKEHTYTIQNLEEDKEYEFYVSCGSKKSRVRLARCGKSFGTVVTYVHPEDKCYDFTGYCPANPTIVRHPDGYLLLSMDLYGHAYPQNLSLIYRSDDDGKTWNYVSELFPCYWGKIFIYEGELYMLSVTTEYGDLLIGKSSDGGKTFGEPTTLLRGSNGKNGWTGVHKCPQPVVEFNGRIWNTMEYGSWGKKFHAAMVMSAPLGSDLLDADSWSFSEPVKYNPEWPGLPKGESAGNIEGCLVDVDGKLYNVMRYQMEKLERNYGLVMAYEVDTENPENPLKFSHCIEFPANHAKFEIKYDERTKKYYSLVSRIWEPEASWKRCLFSLMVSDDCEHWEVKEDIMDMRDEDPKKFGFQYTDFIIEDDKILYACRTAMNGAENYHNSNYIIFGTIQL